MELGLKKDTALIQILKCPEDPATLSKGVDVQLEKAIDEVMRLHKLNPPVNPKQPAYEKR